MVGAVGRIAELFPRNRIFLGGFSLGGNFALRVAVRSPQAGIPIRKTVAICPLLNPEHTMDAIENSFWGYHWYFIRKWRRSLTKKRQYFPNLTGLENLFRF
ncbi:MAG: alpha/beta hydrolase [Desulfobacteraceae bacterium]|nr:alpha/beta hydrolase [Desulfobacteraceae bacterium]